jgi:hypothetical protein
LFAFSIQAFSAIPPGGNPRSLGAPLGSCTMLLAAGDGDDPEKQVADGSGGRGELWLGGPQVASP